MTLLERYIFARAFKFSLAALASLVLIVWIVQVLQRVDIVRTTASAAGDFFFIALMLMPALAAGVLPFAILIGAVQALNALNSDSERTVIAAAGASRITVATPLVVLGIAASLLVLLNSNVVGPRAASAFQNAIRSVNAEAITLLLQPGRFQQVQDGLVISINETRGSRIEGLFLSDRRDPSLDLAYFAEEANIVEQRGRSYLVLANGQLHRRANDDGNVSIIEFQSYAFDLADLRPADTGDWVRMSERSTAELLRPDPSDRLYQTHPERFVEELGVRRTDWLYSIAFVIWAVVVAGHPRTNRQDAGPTMLIAIGGALVLRALGFFAASLVSDDAAMVVLVYAVPIGGIVLGLVLFWRNANIVDSAAVRGTVEALGRASTAGRRLLRPRAGPNAAGRGA